MRPDLSGDHFTPGKNDRFLAQLQSRHSVFPIDQKRPMSENQPRSEKTVRHSKSKPPYNMKTIILLLLSASILLATEPTRQGGLSVHVLPDRVAKLSNEHGGFTVTDPVTKERGTTYATPKELLIFFERLPATVQQNGIWIVVTDPSSYSEIEHAKLTELIKICDQKKIPIYTCRAIDLPKGWKRAT